MGINLSRTDRNKLLMFCYAIAILALVASIYIFGDWINPIWVLVLAIAGQQLYVLPNIYVNYYKLYDMEVSKARSYVPFLNEIEMVPSVYSKILAVLWVLIVVMGIFAAAPYLGLGFLLSLWSIFGDQFAFNSSYYFTLATVLLYILLCLVRGAAFMSMNRHVNMKYYRYFPYSSVISNLMEGGKYIFLFAPLFRVLSLAFMQARLYKIVELNEMQQGKNMEFSVVSEVKVATRSNITENSGRDR